MKRNDTEENKDQWEAIKLTKNSNIRVNINFSFFYFLKKSTSYLSKIIIIYFGVHNTCGDKYMINIEQRVGKHINKAIKYI